MKDKKSGKGIFKKLMILMITLLIVGVAWNKVSGRSFDRLSDEDREMFTSLSQVYKTYRESGEKIWTEDYNFDSIPLILTPVKKSGGIFHTYSYAVGVPELQSGVFAQKIELPEELGLPQVYRISAVNPKLWITFMPVNFTFGDIGDSHAYYFKYTEKSLQRDDTIGSFKYFMMHEAFHEYRQMPKWNNVRDDIPEDKDLITSISPKDLDAEHYGLLLMELEIIDRVRDMEDKEEMEKLLRSWARIREFRYSKYPYMKNEGKIETMEGTAEYIEFAYSRVVGDMLKGAYPLDDGTSYTYGDIFTKERIENITASGGLISFMNKDLYYFTGVDLCTIMDKLGLDWKRRIENEELVPDVLLEHVSKGDAGDIEALKEEFDYVDKVKVGEAILEGMKQ